MSDVKLAPEGTPLARFQTERTEAISEMFDNVDECGIYPTTRFFSRLDACFERELKAQIASAEVNARKDERHKLLDNVPTEIRKDILAEGRKQAESETNALIAAAFEKAARAKCKHCADGNIPERSGLNTNNWWHHLDSTSSAFCNSSEIRSLTPADARQAQAERDAALRSSILATIRHLIEAKATVVTNCEKTREYKEVLDAVEKRLEADNAALREQIACKDAQIEEMNKYLKGLHQP